MRGKVKICIIANVYLNMCRNLKKHSTVRQKLTSISCRLRTRATRCITANVLQTKVDAQCDKLATERS